MKELTMLIEYQKRKDPPDEDMIQKMEEILANLEEHNSAVSIAPVTARTVKKHMSLDGKHAKYIYKNPNDPTHMISSSEPISSSIPSQTLSSQEEMAHFLMQIDPNHQALEQEEALQRDIAADLVSISSQLKEGLVAINVEIGQQNVELDVISEVLEEREEDVKNQLETMSQQAKDTSQATFSTLSILGLMGVLFLVVFFVIRIFPPPSPLF